jgi:hypothetical protein
MMSCITTRSQYIDYQTTDLRSELAYSAGQPRWIAHQIKDAEHDAGRKWDRVAEAFAAAFAASPRSLDGKLNEGFEAAYLLDEDLAEILYAAKEAEINAAIHAYHVAADAWHVGRGGVA